MNRRPPEQVAEIIASFPMLPVHLPGELGVPSSHEQGHDYRCSFGHISPEHLPATRGSKQTDYAIYTCKACGAALYQKTVTKVVGEWPRQVEYVTRLSRLPGECEGAK